MRPGRSRSALRPITDGWTPPVLTCSARDQVSLPELWEQVTAHRATLQRTGALEANRNRQQMGWMWAAVEDRLLSRLHNDAAVAGLVPDLIEGLAGGSTTPTLAAAAILSAFEHDDGQAPSSSSG